MTQAGMIRDLFSEKKPGRPMGQFPICEWIIHGCARVYFAISSLSYVAANRIVKLGVSLQNLFSRKFIRYKSGVASAETQISETILIYYRIQSLRLAFLSISSS